MKRLSIRECASRFKFVVDELRADGADEPTILAALVIVTQMAPAKAALDANPRAKRIVGSATRIANEVGDLLRELKGA